MIGDFLFKYQPPFFVAGFCCNMNQRIRHGDSSFVDCTVDGDGDGVSCAVPVPLMFSEIAYMKCGMKVFLSRCHRWGQSCHRCVASSKFQSVRMYIHRYWYQVLTVRKVRSPVSTHYHHTIMQSSSDGMRVGTISLPTSFSFPSKENCASLSKEIKSIRSKDAFATSSAEPWCTTSVLFRNDNGFGFVKPEARDYNRCSSRRGKI